MFSKLKIEQFIATFLATQVMSWGSFYLSWQTSDPYWGAVVTAVVSIPASIIASIAMILLVRVYRLVNHLNTLAEDAQSEIAGVVMKTDKVAAEFAGDKVVGPSDVKSLV